MSQWISVWFEKFCIPPSFTSLMDDFLVWSFYPHLFLLPRFIVSWGKKFNFVNVGAHELISGNKQFYTSNNKMWAAYCWCLHLVRLLHSSLGQRAGETETDRNRSLSAAQTATSITYSDTFILLNCSIVKVNFSLFFLIPQNFHRRHAGFSPIKLKRNIKTDGWKAI